MDVWSNITDDLNPFARKSLPATEFIRHKKIVYSNLLHVSLYILQLLRWDKVGVSNVAGEIALVFGIVMWVAVLPRIRRQKFEFFFYTHQLYFLFLLFYVLHVGIAFFALILPGVYLFLIDRYLRFLQSRQKVRLVSTRLLPCETLELNFTKSPGETRIMDRL